MLSRVGTQQSGCRAADTDLVNSAGGEVFPWCSLGVPLLPGVLGWSWTSPPAQAERIPVAATRTFGALASAGVKSPPKFKPQGSGQECGVRKTPPNSCTCAGTQVMQIWCPVGQQLPFTKDGTSFSALVHQTLLAVSINAIIIMLNTL